MSWVLTKTTRIYLSRGLMMVAPGTGDVVARELEPTMPLQALLMQADSLIPQQPRVEIHLSAAFCPAVEVAYPKGLERFADKILFARAVCAAQLGLNAEEVVCELDAVNPGVAAPIAIELLRTLTEWISSRNGHLASLSPLWSLVTRCRLSTKSKSLMVVEPDSATLCGSGDAPRAPRAMSIAREKTAPVPGPSEHRVSQTLELDIASSTILRLCAERGPALSGGPLQWQGFWRNA